MRDDGTISVFCRKLNGIHCLRKRTDLIDFDENCIGGMFLDANSDSVRIGDKQVITDQLNPIPKLRGQLTPAFPVVFIKTVFDGNQWVFLTQILVEPDHVVSGAHDLLTVGRVGSGRRLCRSYC